MATKDWKKTINKPDSILFEKGKREQPLHMAEHHIWIKEATPYIKKEFKYNWGVHSDDRINPETIYGKALDFKSKSQALAFAKKYMRSH